VWMTLTLVQFLPLGGGRYQIVNEDSVTTGPARRTGQRAHKRQITRSARQKGTCMSYLPTLLIVSPYLRLYCFHVSRTDFRPLSVCRRLQGVSRKHSRAGGDLAG